MSAPYCTYPFCQRRSRHETRRCHNHRPAPTRTHSKSSADGWMRIITVVGDDDVVGASDGPARVVYERDVTGVEAFHRTEERFYVAGLTHRLDGPARSFYGADGRGLYREEWWIEGRIHRLDGPAVVFYEPDGSVDAVSYVLEGNTHSSGDSFAAEIESWPQRRTLRELGRSSYRELLDEGISPDTILVSIAGDVWSLPGIRAVAAGSPVEWAAAFEYADEITP